MKEYTIGCDPELFVFHKGDKKYVSAFDAGVLGSKKDPFIVDGGATQIDGVAAEFNIDPAVDVNTFVSRITSVMDQLDTQIDDPDIELHAVPVAEFDPEYFKTLSAEELALGCEPDFSAYTLTQNLPPATKECFRTGSGHIHVGYPTPDCDIYEDARNRVKQLDYTVYLCSLLWDQDKKRRLLYGKPGALRFKPYGFEYRTLSNAWLNDTDVTRWVFYATIRAMQLYDDGIILSGNEMPAESYERESLISYHRELVRVYSFPSLPEEYLHSELKAA